MPAASQGAVNLGANMECWLVKFDKDGECISPKTQAALLERLAREPERPVLFFSHGWNNDFDAATTLYRNFLQQFELHLSAQHSPFKPLFVGVIWPSTWLSFNDGLQMAGVQDVQEVTPEERYIAELASALADNGERQRLYALLDTARLDEKEAADLAQLLAKVLQRMASPREGAVEDVANPDMADLLNAFHASPTKSAATADGKLAPGGIIGGTTGGGGWTTSLNAAGALGFLDPRWALRIASVYQMKDRAGTVGGNGVSHLLAGLLGTSDQQRPVHLVGHSFGCKVVLSALHHAPERAKVRSVLLLQPAISYLAFADKVPGLNQAGGYQAIPTKVGRSLMMTYSANDFPLHEVFHLALRRQGDSGEFRAASGEPPNVYAALGGYGPRDSQQILRRSLPAPGERIDLPTNSHPLAFDGSDKQIMGHGDVTTPLTAWLLYLQTH